MKAAGPNMNRIYHPISQRSILRLGVFFDVEVLSVLLIISAGFARLTGIVYVMVSFDFTFGATFLEPFVGLLGDGVVDGPGCLRVVHVS